MTQKFYSKKMYSVIITFVTAILFSLNAVHAQILLTEDFPSMPPPGWTLTGTPTTTNWGISSPFVTFTNPGGAAPIAFFNWTPSQTNYDAQLVSPVINGTANTSITLDYNMALDNYGGSVNNWEVQYKTTASGTWTTLETFTNTGAFNSQDVVRTAQPLTGMGGNNFQIRIRIYALSGTSFDINGWYWDHFVVHGIGGGCSPAPTVSVSGAPTVICSGSSSTLTASCSANCTGITYTWAGSNLSSTTGTSVTASPTSSTTYTVTGDNGTCTATATIGVVVNPAPATPTATATPSSLSCGGSVQLNASPAPVCVANYTTGTIPYAPVSSGTTTVMTWPGGDDDFSAAVPIGFNFNFYCNTYSQLYVSTNGFITFDNSGLSGCCSGQLLPSVSAPNNLIAVCWTDLFVSSPGNIDYFNLTSPNRFVIRYNGVQHCCSGPAQVTAEIILYENGVIEIHNTAITSIGTMTQGIENQTGTVASAVPGRNSTGWSATNDAYRFTPQFNVAYSWLPTLNMNNSNIFNPLVSSISSSTTYTVTATNSFGCTATATAAVTVTPNTINCSGGNVSCFGGNNGFASATLPTGTGPFTYLWDNSNTNSIITGLTAGTYCVTVTDANGCTATCCYTVTQPPALSATAISTIASCPLCPDGTVTIISISGGTSPFVFTNLNNLLPGNYCITVTDANGCTTSACATVGAAGCTLTANMTLNSDVSCFGGNNGSATVTPGGGLIGPFSYQWDNGNTNVTANNLNAGNHTVVLTDNGTGCVTQGNITIGQATAVTASCGGTNVTCFGGNNGGASVTAGGGTPPYTYLWSTTEVTSSIGGLVPGIYCVTVTDANGCTGTCCYTVTQPLALSITGSNTNVVCAESPTGTVTITVTGGTPTYSYLWSTSATTQNLTAVPKGTYTVTVTDANGCTATYIHSVACTDNIAPTLSAGPGSGTAMSVDFESGALPVGWSTTGLWHVTTACPNGTPPNPTHWAYYGIDGLCTYNNGGTNSGDMTSNTVAIPASASSATLRFRYIYAGEGGAPPTGFDNASVKISQNGGAFNQAMALSTTGTLTWLTANISLNAFIGSNVALQWNFSTQDGIANDFLGLQIDSVRIDYVNLQQCPVNIVTTNTPGQCGNNVSWTPPTATDNCAVTLTSSHNPGDFFPVGGPTTVTYTAADGCGNTAQCSFTVTVNDNELPVFNCPGNIVTDCNGVATYSISATDNCGTANLTLTSGLASGSTFPVGITNVCYNADDGHGNTSTCCFFVTRYPALTASCSGTNVSCNGGNNGNASVIPGGGNPSYSYLWDGGQTTQTAVGLVAGTYCVTVTDASGCTATCCYTVTEPAPLTVGETHNNVSCFGGNNGNATALPAGGTSPYTYAWSSGSTNQTINGLVAGNYTCIVTDNHGCTNFVIVNVTQPAQLFITETHVNVSCKNGSDGSIDITLTGGTPPFTYIWSNGATTEDLPGGLNALAYFVTVTQANGCTQVFGVNVTEPTAIAVTSSLTNPTSGNPTGGAINLTTTGGTPPYTWAWSNGALTEDISGLTAGTYTVLVTDANGCTKTVTYNLTLQCNLSAVNTILQNASCFKNNGIAMVTASGGTSYTYLWNNGQTTATGSGLAYGSNSYCTITDALTGCSKIDTVVVPLTTAIGCTLSSPNLGGGKNISCNGGSNGSINSSISGDPGPFSYLWSNGATTANISSLTAGTYTLTVTTGAGGCASTSQITLTQPSAITASTSIVNPSCGGNNGSATITASGGTPGYTYLWTGGQTTATAVGLAAGIYTATVTDLNGCTKTKSVTLTGSSGLIVTGIVTNAKCFGSATGSIDITPAGGNPPYTYLWSTGHTTQDRLNVLAIGTYTVVVTDSKGCSGQFSATINQPTAITATSTSTNVSCFGGANGTAGVTPSGGTPPYTYTWNTTPNKTTQSVSGLKKGTYTCIITDANGCVKSVVVTITEPPALTLSISKTNVSVFGGNNGTATANVGGGTPPYSYSWSTAPVQITQTATGLIAGTYTVTVTDSKGCTKSATVTITQPGPRSLNNADNENLSVIYPNPTAGLISLSFNEVIQSKVSIEIYNLTGERVYSKEVKVQSNSNSFNLDLSQLAKGVYTVKYQTGDHDWIDKLVIQ